MKKRFIMAMCGVLSFIVGAACAINKISRRPTVEIEVLTVKKTPRILSVAEAERSLRLLTLVEEENSFDFTEEDLELFEMPDGEDAMGGLEIPLADIEEFDDDPDELPDDFVMPEGDDDIRQQEMLEQAMLADMVQLDFPVANVSISSNFGPRRSPISGEPSRHCGIDFRRASNDHAIAAEDGSVVEVYDRCRVIDDTEEEIREKKKYWCHEGYGNKVVIEHNHGYRTLYAHLAHPSVAVGDYVYKGDRLGTIGKTGSATGEHVHFELHTRSQTCQNPWKLLPH